jgi:DNA-binding Xre family transcriptional regulator
MGEKDMITFERLWKTMEKKNVSTYKLREECGIDSKTIRRLKAGENIETKTLNKLCLVLDCKLEDIAEYIPD